MQQCTAFCTAFLLTCPEELPHLVGCLLLHRRHEMAVNIQGDRYGRVAKHLLHNLGVDAVAEP